MTDSNQALKNKMIERVRALLAMGDDVSSPYEASIALTRARKLMDKYQINSIDIQNCTDDDFNINGFKSPSSQNRLWLGMLAISVAKLNDCIAEAATREYSSEKVEYSFKGFVEDTQMCNFMMAYLISTAERLYQRDRKEHGLSGKRDKNGYLVGFSNAIAGRVNKMIAERNAASSLLSTSTSLVLAKKRMVEERFGKQDSEPATMPAEGMSRSLGEKAANEVHLGNFVEGTEHATAHIA